MAIQLPKQNEYNLIDYTKQVERKWVQFEVISLSYCWSPEAPKSGNQWQNIRFPVNFIDYNIFCMNFIQVEIALKTNIN